MRDLAFIYANGLGVVAVDIKTDYWTQKADEAEQEIE